MYSPARVTMGNYPKWLGKIVVWFLNKRLPKTVKFVMRGRMPNWKSIQKEGYQVNRYRHVPLRHAKRVGIYLVEKPIKQVVMPIV